MISRFVFGDDIFISYSRLDAVRYAEGLAGELADKGYSCRIDQWESEPGKEMPASLLRALDRASMLVVVGTRGAAASGHVGKEVEQFVRRKRPVVPVDFDGSTLNAVWYPAIQGLVLEPETREGALTLGQPSPAVVSRIQRSFTYRSRNERLQRVFRVTVAGIVAGVALLALLSYRASIVQGQLQGVSGQLATAQQGLEKATGELEGKAREIASAQTQIARAEKDLAATRTAVLAAREEAERQGRISRSRALASTADVLRTQRAAFLPRSALLAVEAFRQAPTIEADQALRGALAASPLPLRSFTHDGAITAIALSANGELLATAGPKGVSLWNAETGQLRRRLELGDAFVLLAFTPDGSRVVATARRAVHIWTVADGRHHALRTRGLIHDVAISPDGRHLVVAEAGAQAATVHALDGGASVATLPIGDSKLSGGVPGVAFDPQGGFLATGRRDLVVLWDTRDWRAIRTVKIKGSVRRLAVGPRSDRLAVAMGTGLLVLDLQEPDAVPVTLHPREVASVSFHPDGKTIAAGAGTTARIWDVESGQQLATITTDGRVHDVAFSPDGRFLATSTTGVASLWGAQSGTLVAHMVQEGNATRTVFNGKGTRAATSAGREKAMLWQPESGRALASIPDVDGFSYSAEGNHLATTAGGLELRKQQFVATPRPATLIGGGGRLLAVDQGEAALVWSVADGRVAAKLEHTPPVDWEAVRERMRPRMLRGLEVMLGRLREQGSVKTLALSADGRYAVTARIDQRVRLWDVARGTTIAETPFELERVVELARPDAYPVRAQFSGNSATLAVQHGRKIEIWHPARLNARGVVEVKEEVTDFALDPTGSYLAVSVVGDDPIRIFAVSADVREVAAVKDTDELRLVLFGSGSQFAPAKPVRAMGADTQQWRRDPLRAATATFRPGAQWLARADGERAMILDARTLRVVRTFTHELAVSAVALSGDGQYLATASGGDIRVWNATSGEEAGRIAGGGDQPAFSPDHRLLATRTPGGVQVWWWRADDMAAEMCSRLTRNLSCAEWTQYIGGRAYERTCRALPAEACR